jgi:hypothetical protein
VIALLANVVQNNQNTLLEAVTVGIVKKNTLPEASFRRVGFFSITP